METVPQLPQDIIVNILSRLPVKYLIQLKCVCKPWRSLISDPQFAKLHLAQSKKKNTYFSSHRVLLITLPLESVACESPSDDDLELDDVVLDFPAAMKKTPDSDELVDDLEIGGSCNGLICIVFENGRIFLYNPTIREAMELATDNGTFDPKGAFFYGLGHDLSTDDYKVVRAGRHSSSDKTEVEILALKRNTWRRVEEAGILLHGGAGIYVNGALHWLAIRANDPNKMFVIVAFDMVEEKFHELVAIPDNIQEAKHHSMVLTMSGDTLCLFCGGGYISDLEAWQLKEYGVRSSWNRLFGVYRETIPGHKYWENALYYTKTGEVLLDYDGRDLVWYDPKENTTRIFTPQNDWDWFQPAIYVESLVSPTSYFNSSLSMDHS